MDASLKSAGTAIGVNHPKKCRWKLLVIILLAIAARGWLLFSTPLVPGMNGGYYLLQARSLLTHGKLGIPDLPLMFCVQAALARCIQVLSGWDLDASIVFAVKLADAVLPVLVALPVYSLVRRWGRAASAPAWIALAAATLVTLDAPALSMAGDFEKNSLAMVWLASLLLFIHIWIGNPTPRNAASVVCFWGLTGLTHIAVFGASLLFGGLAILFYLPVRRASAFKSLWPLLVGVTTICALAAGAVLWKFDAHRVHRLAAALIHPTGFLSESNMPMPGSRMAGGMGGGMNFFMVIMWLPSLLFAAIALAAMLACWRQRAKLPAGELCTALACATGVLVLTGPWVHGDKTMRFHLIAIVPAVLAGAFAVQHWKRSRLRGFVVLFTMFAMIGPSIGQLVHGGQPIINEAAVSELRTLAPLIANPARTLIAARHGVEWWTAWTLHTHIAHSDSLQPDDWRNFEAVYFLRSKHGGFPMMGGRPPGPLLFGALGRAFQPPPPPDARGMFPPRGGPGDGFPPRGGGLPGAMAEPEIPANAEIVHDGEDFILARVKSPPELIEPASRDR